MVYGPNLELVLAAVWAGYRPSEFVEMLDLDWQARIIAAYRVHNQMEGVLEQERVRKMEQKRRQRG